MQRQIPTWHFYLCCGGTRSNSLGNWCFNSTRTHDTHNKKLVKLSNGCESCLGASWQRRDTNVMEHTCDFLAKAKAKACECRRGTGACAPCVCVSLLSSQAGGERGERLAQTLPVWDRLHEGAGEAPAAPSEASVNRLCKWFCDDDLKRGGGEGG